MEEKCHLKELGLKIKEIRNCYNLSQIAFYRAVFPEKNLEEENIKKKMNAIEHGKGKRLNYELLLRLHEKFDVSLDYLFGFETDYPNYDNKAASQYTGLSAEAIKQLHFWSMFKDKEVPKLLPEMTKQQRQDYYQEYDRIRGSKWILGITSKLLECKSEKEKQTEIADLSILYDIYMMSIDPPDTVLGLPADIAGEDIPWIDRITRSVKIASGSISYVDSMNEIHTVNIGEINKQVWKDRLLHDLEDFIANIKKNETVD